MIATPTTMPTFTANRTKTIAPSTPPTMATVTTDGGDAVGKARGMAEDGGRAYAGLDSLLMPPPPARLGPPPLPTPPLRRCQLPLLLRGPEE